MRRSLVTFVLALVMTAVLAPARPAFAGDEFRFFGSGFGHGLGMSQWGSYGLAQKGWAPARILRHYYSGTTVGNEASPPARLRIGLAQRLNDVRLGAELGDVEIRLGDPQTGDVVATVPSGLTYHVRVANTGYRIVDQNGNTVDRVGGPSMPIFAVFEPLGSRVRVPEASHTYNRGWIEFGLYSCSAACDMRLILVVPPQEYLYGLAEVPSSWPMAALKAQAIAARTYAFTKAAISQHRAGCDCALYASTFDQVYAGWDKEGGIDGDRWVEAVDDTNDEVVKDGGSTIQAFYMSSSGGHTENNENVWGGTPIGYLRGVCDPGDYTAANPNATWDVTFSAGDVTHRLKLGIGTVTRFASTQRGISGRIMSVLVEGENGSEAISGATLRSALGLRDDRVWVDANRQITGEIRAKYDAIGCSPGIPTSRQAQVAGGLRQEFEGGNIYFKAGVGAHELHGAVLTRYVEKAGPRGRLGFPTTDVRRLDNGRLRARFEHGSITCDGTSCTVG
jgi:SpoIID/LytB domain protein